MESTINSILEKYTKELINIYGEHLKSVILYGSYANVKKEEVGLYRLEWDCILLLW